MPRQDNIRYYDGVIFLRKGIFRDGVFRFTIELPAAYNDTGTYPTVIFNPPIFHPLINPKVGFKIFKFYSIVSHLFTMLVSACRPGW